MVDQFSIYGRRILKQANKEKRPSVHKCASKSRVSEFLLQREMHRTEVAI